MIKQNSSNIDAGQVMNDLRRWLNDIKASSLMIESALITLDAYFEEENK